MFQGNHLAPPMANGMFLPPNGAPQFFPLQLPMGSPVYGNGAMYLVMPPQMSLDGSRAMSRSTPNMNVSFDFTQY